MAAEVMNLKDEIAQHNRQGMFWIQQDASFEAGDSIAGHWWDDGRRGLGFTAHETIMS